MLDTTLVLLLQEQASPALTEIMRAVSFWGYVPSCLTVAIVCGFGWRLRLGVTLILAIIFADAITIVAKGAFASPRPHDVDARVQTFGAFESGLSSMATGTSVPADDFGFPSGHVAATAAWALGLAWYRLKPWRLAAAATWIALMGLSRMYLGRHFPADVIGGFVVGVAGLAIGRLELPPAAAGMSTLTAGTRMALGVSLLVLVALASLFGVGLGAHDGGRFCGLLGAALLAHAHTGARRFRPAIDADRSHGCGARSLRCGGLVEPVDDGPRSRRRYGAAALHASVLLVPALAVGGHRA